MSLARSTGERMRSQNVPAERRPRPIKVFIFVAIMLLLLVNGLLGRRTARIEGGIDQIMTVRDELQQRLDEPNTPGGETKAVAEALKERLRQFDAQYDPAKLSPVNRLRTRLCRGTLGNAEQRFSDALTVVNDDDEKTSLEALRVLQVRGDAFYGRREWQNALTRYERMLLLQTNRKATIRRVAECRKWLTEPAGNTK